MSAPRAVAFILLLVTVQEISAQRGRYAAVSAMLDFEGDQTGGPPRDWMGGPSSTLFTDSKTTHGGKWALRLDRARYGPEKFSHVAAALPVGFSGGTVELRGFLKSENVDGFFGLWLRQDAEGTQLALENMQSRRLRGTTEWTEYSITLPLYSNASKLVFGVLLEGRGTVWADDLQLLVDGRPFTSVPLLRQKPSNK